MSWTSAFASRRARRLTRLVAVLGEPKSLARRAREVGDWHSVVSAAFDHGVGGLLVASLGAAGVELPAPVGEGAEQILVRDRLWHRKVLADLGQVLEAFERAGIRSVALKGPVLGERIYPEPALRPAGDLDFLVTPDTFDRAMEVLRTLGMVERTPPHVARRAPHAAEFESPDRIRVELHWQASSRPGTTLDSAPLVARSVPFPLGDGHETRVLELADELLYLAVHAARHRLTRLRWLWEIRTLLERCSEEELERFLDRAREANVARAVAVTLGVLHERLKCARAGECSRRLPRGLLLRAELAIAGIIPGRSYRDRGPFTRSLFVLSEHTYRALLAEEPGAAMKQWRSAVGRSIGSLLRRK